MSTAAGITGGRRASAATGGTAFDAGLCPNCVKYCQCETAIETQAGNLKFNCSVIEQGCAADPENYDQGCQAQLRQIALSGSVPAECL
jgi:hypothetical protein